MFRTQDTNKRATFFPNKGKNKPAQQRLDGINDKEIRIVATTTKEVEKANTQDEWAFCTTE